MEEDYPSSAFARISRSSALHAATSDALTMSLSRPAPKRVEVLPEVPTMSEAGVNGFEANTWWGAVVPAATPKDVVAKLNAEINRILATNEVRKLFQSQDVQMVGGTTDTCADYIRSQVALWSKVVREAKIKAE